jgi:hypothetical protein
MQQIADWLEKLGMPEYAQRFAENRIDFSVLRELTDQDLKDLGVVLGDRRKMLRAIADIGDIEKNAPAAPAKATAAPRGTPVASEPIPTATPRPISAAAEVSGERRYVTVMFCDLVGSTSISALRRTFCAITRGAFGCLATLRQRSWTHAAPSVARAESAKLAR